MHVSVVIPVFNGERFLADAVGSVRAQRHDQLEIVVVDDGSTDGTAGLAERLGVRCLQQENAGPAAARNAGLAATTGEVVAFLDCDDLWPDGSLRLRLDRLAAEAELDIVLGRVQVEYLAGALPIEFPFADRDGTLTHQWLGAGLYRRRVFDRIGLFDPAFRHAEDVDWFLRALEAGIRLRIMDAVTMTYRLHADNLTRDRERHEAALARALGRSLARRRSGGVVTPLPAWSAFDERALAARGTP